jgi:5-methylcytosine-specific restriction endonuclease McrA
MADTQKIKRVDKRKLLKGLAVLVRDDHALTADLLEHIGEVDRRQLYLELAYPSMFAFCVGRYRMSESMAAKRIRAGRAARRFPCILGMVRKGQLHLTGVHQLAGYLTEENHQQVLRRAKCRTSKEIDELIAEIAPRADGKTVIQPLSSPANDTDTKSGSAEARARVEDGLPATAAQASEPLDVGGAPHLPANSIRSVTVPLSPQRYRLHVTVGKEAVDNLEELVNLLSHQLPNGDAGQVVERALELLLEDTKKRRAALVKRPRKRKRNGLTSKTRSIPAAVKREVFQRDGGKCAFVNSEGRRCNSAWKLEYHHVVPFGREGPTTADNLQLRCKAHNQYEAEQDYGRDFMKKKRRKTA